ncbi:MAG: stage V sporulation protein AD [Clostridiales bacterium]|jgi:stage V sporulation protein AD|nr:stage V sporulation protein AD [Clostridiales bacterium]
MNKHLGAQSVWFENVVSVNAAASVVGPKEGQGPLGKYFDIVCEDNLFGADSWEKAESEFARRGLDLAVKKSGLPMDNMDYIISGDLLNQSTGSTFGVIDTKRPFFGIFGACSTIGEGMALGSVLIDGGFAYNVLAGAGSHFCAAEKQFRFPLELGSQRPPSSTWTVTGHGAVVLSNLGEGPFVTGATTGKIVDMGVKDQNNMGAVMAPAAADTIASHLRDFNRAPDYYDLILTGDLGYVGRDLLYTLMKDEGYDISRNHKDCGIEIFDRESQDTHSGGSGCACAASVFSAYFWRKLKEKSLNKVLFVPTGALLSPTSFMQGENIPAIAHAVALETSR